MFAVLFRSITYMAMTNNEETKQIFFHPGLGNTGTTYLQYKFFPKLAEVYYISRKKYQQAAQIIQQTNYSKYLVSHNLDKQFFRETDRFAAQFPDAYPVIVLRKHSKWAAAQYKKALKKGKGLYFKEFIDVDHNEGVWDRQILYFYDKIVKLEEAFSHKPLVLFYEELEKYPHGFLGKLSRFMGVNYDPNQVSLKPIRRFFDERQLILLRHIARKTFNKWTSPEEKWMQRWQNGLRKFFTHLIMYLGWVVPKGNWLQEPLIPAEELEKIDRYYQDDWQKCKQYARNHPLESLLHTPNII